MSLLTSTKEYNAINLSAKSTTTYKYLHDIFLSDHTSLFINNEQIYNSNDKTQTFKELLNGNEIKQKIQTDFSEFLKNIDIMAKLMDSRLRYLTMKINLTNKLIEIDYYPYGENGLNGLYNGTVEVIDENVKSEDPFYFVKTF